MAYYWFACAGLLIAKNYIMALVYIIFKIVALLAIIIIPLTGPKRKKSTDVAGVSKFAVNEDGYLEHYIDNTVHPHPVQ